jgi:hypothetical protein
MILTRGVGIVNAWGEWAGSYCGAILRCGAWLRTGAKSQRRRQGRQRYGNAGGTGAYPLCAGLGVLGRT